MIGGGSSTLLEEGKDKAKLKPHVLPIVGQTAAFPLTSAVIPSEVNFF